jgi:membrane protein DedA with SNARE-associated domain/membrane-associated phospholipid phosphatase
VLSHVQQILHLIVHYGYLVVFFGVMAESAGVPLPGETILIASGILAEQSRLDLGDVIFFGALGAVVGDQIGYWVGRKGGRPFVLRWGRYVKITPERLAGAERFFARHGGKAVFFARFFSGLRVFGALVAGLSRMRFGTFLFYNALGGAVWATAAVLVGYLLGGSLGIVEQWLGKASLLLGILAVLAVVLYLLYRWTANHPERLRGAFERLGGERIQRFLESRAGLWLRRRFSPRGAYGLALTAGLALVGLFSWAFGAVVQDVVARDPLVRVDVRILEFFHSHSEPALTAAVSVFEAVFSPEVLLSAGAIGGSALVFLAYRRADFSRGFPGFVLLAAVFGTGALSVLFMFLFHRPPPLASLRLVSETGDSFPSADAMTVVAVGATVWYLWSLRPVGSWGGSWRAKARVGLVVVALSLLVGLGRVYTGAHYPSDVLAGWALGGAWASVCLTAAELFRRLRAGGRQLPEAGVRYAQFSLVGASNALVDLGTLNLLLLLFPTRSPADLVLYNLLALALTNANSYLWNTLWTFRHHARHDAWQVGMFALQAALSIGVGNLVLWLVARGLVVYEDLSPLVAGNTAKVLSMLAGSTTSFVVLRFFVFSHKKRG